MNRKRLLISLLLVFAVFLPMSIFAEEDYLNYDFKTPLNVDGTVKLYVDKGFEHFIVAGQGKMDPDPYFASKISDFFDGLSESEKDALRTRMDDIDENGYVLEIKSGVQLPDNSGNLFSYYNSNGYIEEIKFPQDLDTSNVTNMSDMFNGTKIANPDVSKWDTSKVTDMSGMFYSTENANPDVSKWNTSKVESFSFMFAEAKKADPDTSGWDLSKGKYFRDLFSNSSITELDIRNSNMNNEYSLHWILNETDKTLQYFYLPADHPSNDYTYITDSYYTDKADKFKMQKDNEAAKPAPGEYKEDGEFVIEVTGVPTLYFLPQETSLNVVWKDNDNAKGFRPNKQKVELLANGKDISAPMTIPPETNPIELNDINHWQYGYSDLDIFNGGKKIDYTLKSEDLDDYITDYVFKKEGTVLYSSQKGKIEDQAPGFTIINTYMTIAEEKPLGEKPRVPKNFVKVTVDTTDKATSDTQFKRAFWVTPNVELELPVGEPTGKSDQAHKYTFEGWKGLEPSALKWNKGEKIKAKFTSDTTIEAQYKDENKQKPPKPPVVDPKDNEDKPQEPPVIEDTRRPKYRDTRDTNKTISASKTFNETITVKANEETHTAYIKGYPDGTFRPEKSITRAEAITMLVGLKGYPLIEARETYKDVDKNKWYAPYIDAAYREGILEEKEGENFRPDENIKRGELAQIISHIDKKNDAKAPFTDIEGYKYKKAIDQSYGNKRIMGYPDNTFRPNAEITRAETVAILNRLFERCVREEGLENVEISKFKDLQDKSYWAYYEIIEASQTHTFARTNQNTVEEVWKTIIK